MNAKSDSELVSNRRAFFDYEILETFEAGIELKGTEVSSLRLHGGSLQDSYIIIAGNAAYLKGSSIAPYKFGNIYNHEEKRERKLLLHKRELLQLKTASQEKGLTLLPLSFYLKKGLVKVKIAIARGKKAYDKRETIKAREQKKHMDRAMKGVQE